MWTTFPLLGAVVGAPALLRAQASASVPAHNTIIGVICEGNHRVPCDTIKTRIYSKPGSELDPAQVNRDFMALWNSGFFDDLKIEREDTPQGVLLHIHVSEKPLIREIKYKGLKSITESDILDRWKARNVRLTRDDQFDPTRAKHAEDAIKELLAEHGRQYASVKTVLTQLPPSSVALTFDVNEGPKVEVGKIAFHGNTVMSSLVLRRSMKNLRPIGIPDSLIFENLFSKTYDAAKLSEDLERVRGVYQDRGYFSVIVEDPTLKQRDTHSMHVLFWGGHPGKKVDITIPIVEGNRFRVGKVNFVNNKFINDQAVLTNVFGMHQGEILNISKLRKGLENLRKLYGEFGYINFVANPDPQPDEKRRVVNLTLDVQEGKPYFVRRIEFSGNTTTRDKVIRRELLIDEGGRFNSQAWDTSLLRLNQLGYFDPVKPEDAEIRQDSTGPEGQVDINLKLKEKGKNTIGLTGGVSGLAGSFLGLNYSTNNFLGLGETLSFSGEYGALQRIIQFGFTEPYLFDRNIQLGFSVFGSDYRYDQARQASIFAGQNLVPYFSALGQNQLLNYTQNSKGFTVTTSMPLKRSFTRLGLTYGYNISNLTPLTQAATLLFNSVSFRGISGPSNLTGIATSSIIPSFEINTVNSQFQPTGGKEVSASTEFTGLGGNVKIIRPSLSFRYFHPAWRNHVVGFRLLGSMVSGYGGGAPPTFDRFFVGGEDTIRGFDILAVTPIAMIPTETTQAILNPLTGGQLVKLVPQPTPTNPNAVGFINFQAKVPTYQITTPGGDTEAIGNFEYRIPIFGPVTLAAFFDAGINRISLPNQLRVNTQVLNQLNTDFGRQFNPRVLLAPTTNSTVRISTGLELQFMLPIIQAPFRIYYAVNPSRVDTAIHLPVIATQQDFLRGVPAAFQSDADVLNAVNYTLKQLQTAAPLPFKEPPHTFRFTISRTF